MNATNSYDKLYDTMKARFTVSDETVKGYTLGDYMLLKANEKKPSQNLPVAAKNTAIVAKSEHAVSTIVSFVNDKLTIKQMPPKDKIIRTFPLRASASAILSAAVTCAFIFSFCLIGAKVIGASTLEGNESATVEYTEAGDYTTETANYYFE